MGFKKYKYTNSGETVVYSGEVDAYFKKNYGFIFDDECFGYGFGLERLFRLNNGDYLRVNLTKDYIYLYQEYDCGGKIWDLEVDLRDSDVRNEYGDIDINKLEDLLDELLDDIL